MPLAVVVDLTNGWGTLPRKTAADRDAPPASDLLGLLGESAAGMSDVDLQRVADRLFSVFTATSPRELATRVTDLLARSGVRPALDSDHGRLRPTWLVKHPRDLLLAAAAVALHAQLAEHGAERLGTCGADHCADVYVDASPAGHRRFCSVTCQNRERVAVFRRRRAAARS